MIASFKKGKTVTVQSEIIEDDNYPNVGRKKSTHIITEADLVNGFTIEQDIVVKENNGRYSGKKAYWTVTYTFTPAEVTK